MRLVSSRPSQRLLRSHSVGQSDLPKDRRFAHTCPLRQIGRCGLVPCSEEVFVASDRWRDDFCFVACTFFLAAFQRRRFSVRFMVTSRFLLKGSLASGRCPRRSLVHEGAASKTGKLRESPGSPTSHNPAARSLLAIGVEQPLSSPVWQLVSCDSTRTLHMRRRR